MGKEKMETVGVDSFFEEFCSEGEQKNGTKAGGGMRAFVFSKEEIEALLVC